MFIQKKGTRVVANDEFVEEEVVDDVADEMVDDAEMEEETEVIVDPEATDLLFEAEDVAELLAEATGEAVEVTVDDDIVEFAIGDVVLTAEAEGDEEVLEACTKKVMKGKRTVAASKKAPAKKAPVKASRTVRKAAPARPRRK